MQKLKFATGVAILTIIVAVLTVQIVESTPSGKNAGWFRSSYPDLRPQSFSGTWGAVSANVSFYVPGIKTADHILLCLEFDSTANNAMAIVNQTDSTYIQDNDTIRCGTATTASSDILIVWQKSNW